ncbi:hypothetical protein L3X38_018204 [Prunus dulcis]|uniref:Uncharacterized protein n=1 Tax=Prunus dulcis TaxID=3755 RepID=A0AAD4Z9W0_PRUDU|nr:hypothetical protein L3X38_018204 [Prunus dulcis]
MTVQITVQWTVKTFQLLNKSNHLQFMLVNWCSLDHLGSQKLTHSAIMPVAYAFPIKLTKMKCHVSNMDHMLKLFLELLIHRGHHVAFGLTIIINVLVILSTRGG